MGITTENFNDIIDDYEEILAQLEKEIFDFMRKQRGS